MQCGSNCKRKLGRAFCRDQFRPKKTPPRKTTSVSSLHRELFSSPCPPMPNVRLKLGAEDVTFCQGQWTGSRPNSFRRALAKSERRIRTLIRQNSLLKIKMEVLIDMLAESTAQVHLRETQIERLKSMFT